ncbi:hypothetical protein SASPL_121423 [Salvia splendens]|uniref:D-aminoacyl-tRNA deacylase n=1 Tax=Salvia splendens TaxID=180675 RepID=A0A8X8ZUR4_SALSN|nr:hypothetical protein SASPL_121423 [Salvia splendens]
MRAVVQRVASASVEIAGGRPLDIVDWAGPACPRRLHEADAESDAEYICCKVLNMRLFPSEKTGKAWYQNVMLNIFEVLLVSQFTLYGVLKGNNPDFHGAMPPSAAKSFYASLVERFQKAYRADAVKDGVFGAMMEVKLVSDGPMTMQVDSSKNTNGD